MSLFWLTFLMTLLVPIITMSIINICNNLTLPTLFPTNETLVIVNYIENNVFNEIIIKYNASVVIMEEPFNRIKNTPDFTSKNFLIFAKNNNDSLKTIKGMQFLNIWNKCYSSSGKFLVVCKNCTMNIFKQFWQMDISQVILYNFTHYISSSPYIKENQCGQKLDWFLTEPCNAIKTTTFFKMPNTIEHCNITAFPINKIYNFPILHIINNKTTGLLVKVIEIIATTLNANLVVIEDDNNLRYHEKFFANRQFFYNLINNRTIDLILGMAVMNINILDVCRCTKVFFEDSRYWVVSKPQKISNLKLFFMVFNARTWLFFIVIHIMSSFTFYVLSTYRSVESSKPNFSRTVLDFIKIVFENSITLPILGKLQLFLVFFLWYNLIMTSYYKSGLASVLTEPIYEKKFSSFADMLEHNIKFLMVSTVQDVILNEKSISQDYIKNNFIERHDLIKEPDCVEDIIKYRNFTTHVKDVYFKVYPNWKEQVKIIGSQHLNPIQFIYEFRHSYPFRNRINEVIGMMTSHGIIIKIANSFKKNVWISNEEINTRLTINHLMCAFVIILVGALCGFCVFVLEVVHLCFNM